VSRIRRGMNLSRQDRNGDAGWEARAVRRAVNSEPAPYLSTIGAMGGCWCGEEHNHDWPGKADGAPHPRPARYNQPEGR
jgi:hypothetical protein